MKRRVYIIQTREKREYKLEIVSWSIFVLNTVKTRDTTTTVTFLKYHLYNNRFARIYTPCSQER